MFISLITHNFFFSGHVPTFWACAEVCFYNQVVDEHALQPEVQEYLGRGKPKTELKVSELEQARFSRLWMSMLCSQKYRSTWAKGSPKQSRRFWDRFEGIAIEFWKEIREEWTLFIVIILSEILHVGCEFFLICQFFRQFTVQ
jgi:hypothetical protein